MVEISIVIPTYNHERYIRDSIDSALNQTHKDVEVIVVDDGGTDGTGEIVKSYGDKVTYIHQQNRGVTHAMNTGAKRTKGEFILFLSSDDILMPDIIEKQLEVLRNRPDVDFVYTDYYFMNEDNKILETIRCPFFEDYGKRIAWMFRYCYFMHDTVLFRRRLLEKVGFWDEDMPYAGEYWMWFKCLKVSNVAHISTPLVKYRIHGTQLTTHTKQIKKFRKETIRRARKLYGVGWSIRSRILSSRIFGVYWLAQGLFFADRPYGLYWAKHAFQFGEGVLDKYMYVKNVTKYILEKQDKVKLTASQRLWLFAYSTLSRVRNSFSGTGNIA
jgi:glycosyltransferase involved in cell wall biosynthesis